MYVNIIQNQVDLVADLASWGSLSLFQYRMIITIGGTEVDTEKSSTTATQGLEL